MIKFVRQPRILPRGVYRRTNRWQAYIAYGAGLVVLVWSPIPVSYFSTVITSET